MNKLKMLSLGIFEGLTKQSQIIDLIVEEFEADINIVKKYEYLINYVDYGYYEGTGYILMKDKLTGELFENHSGHCSCYGNEGQFEPELANIKYLKSDKFSCYTYDNKESELIKNYIKLL